MAKYDLLEAHLRRLGRERDHRLSFAEIAAVLGSPLPKSALQYPAWWANQRGSGHVQANAWLNAGFHSADVDLKRRSVTFRPVDLPREPNLALKRASGDRPLTIAQAKRGLALNFGVGPEAIDIRIRA